MSRFSKNKTSKSSKPSKKTIKKVMRYRSKKVKSMASKNMDTKFVKAVFDWKITPAQGALVSNYVYNNYQLVAPTSVYTSVLNTKAYKTNAVLYDRVRINKIKVTYTPKANVFDAGNAQNDSQLTLSGNGMVDTAIDRDTILPWANTGVSEAFQQYPSYRQFPAYKRFSRSYSVKYPTSVWLDTANIFEDSTLLKRLGLLGNIGVYAENLVEDKGEIFNEPYADVRIEYSMVFQGTKPTNISLDASGNVLISPIEPNESDRQYETIGSLALQDISGNQLDNSGNII